MPATLVFAVFLLFFTARSQAIDPQTHACRTPRNLIEVYHPLIPGTIWKYHIQEHGRFYVQTIKVKADGGPGAYVLETSSPRRITRYHISTSGETAFLHRVAGRLSLVPFWREQVYDPPLPFLNLAQGLTGQWAWVGTTRGFGPKPDQVRYSIRPLVEENMLPNTNVLEVTAVGNGPGQPETVYRARYEATIGLVHMETDGYSKVLIEHREP